MRNRSLISYLVVTAMLTSFVQAPLAIAAAASAKAKRRAPVSADGKQDVFSVKQRYDSRGRLVRETIVGADYTEFVLRDPVRKTNVEWEVSKPSKGLRFHALYPAGDHFSRLELEQKRPGGKLQLVYAYNDSIKSYRILSARFDRDRVMHKDDIPYDSDVNGNYVNTCSAQVPGLVDTFNQAGTWFQMLQKISQQGQQQELEVLQCYLNHYQNAIFDSGCTKAPFASSLDNMKKGLIDLIMSDNAPTGGNQKAEYLQCLTQQKFSAETARIETFFSTIASDLQQSTKSDPFYTDLKNALAKNDGGAALAQVCASTKPYPGPFNLVRKTSPIACVSGLNSSEISQYDASTDQIIVRSSGLSEQDYATALFHEGLHKSGIENETLTYALENCCNGSADSASECLRGAAIAQSQNLFDRYTTGFEQQFNDFVSFSESIKNQLSGQYGTSTDGSDLLQSYFSGYGSHKATAQKIYTDCMANHGTDEDCSQKYLADMAKWSQDFFNDPKYCAHYEALQPNPSTTACSVWGQQISNMLLSGKASSGHTSSEIRQSLDNPAYDAQASLIHKNVPAGAVDVATDVAGVPPSTSDLGSVTAGSSNLASGTTNSNVSTAPPPSNNKTLNPPPTVANAGSSAINTAPVQLGNVSQQRNDVASRRDRGTTILNGMGSLMDRVGDAILPRAQAATGNAERSQYSPETLLTSRLDPSLATLSPSNFKMRKQSIDRNSVQDGSAPAAAAQGSSASGGGGSIGESSEGSAPGSSSAGDKKSEVGNRTHGPNTALKATAGGSTAGDPGAPGDGNRLPAGDKSKSADELSFSNPSALRSFITGDYARVRSALTSARQSTFVRSLINYRIQITDDRGKSYGPRSAQEIYLYCKAAPGLLRSTDPRLSGVCQP